MTRTIRVEVLRDGRVQVDFVGFPGETCVDEEENLTRLLKSLGLWAIPVTIQKKDQATIRREVGEEEERGMEVKVE